MSREKIKLLGDWYFQKRETGRGPAWELCKGAEEFDGEIFAPTDVIEEFAAAMNAGHDLPPEMRQLLAVKDHIVPGIGAVKMGIENTATEANQVEQLEGRVKRLSGCIQSLLDSFGRDWPDYVKQQVGAALAEGDAPW